MTQFWISLHRSSALKVSIEVSFKSASKCTKKVWRYLRGGVALKNAIRARKGRAWQKFSRQCERTFTTLNQCTPLLTEKNLKKNLFTLRLPLEIGVEGRVYFARHLAVSSQIAFQVFFLFAVTARHPAVFNQIAFDFFFLLMIAIFPVKSPLKVACRSMCK